MDFLNHREGGMVFLIYPLQCTVTLQYVRDCVSLKTQNSQGKAEEVARRKTLRALVWISSKKSPSGFTS
jgi:hypothetical protein